MVGLQWGMANITVLGMRNPARQQLGKVLLGCSPERLPTFGCVDPVQPNLVLEVVHVQQRDGVAIIHPHDAALDLVRTYVRTGDQAEQAQRDHLLRAR